MSALAALSLTACGTDKPAGNDSNATNNSQAAAEGTTYAIVDDNSDHVVAVGLPASAKPGETITFSLAVEPGYEITDSLPVVTCGGQEVALTANDDGTYSFVMPSGAVTITETSQIANYGIATTVGGTLTYQAYKKVPMKDVYQEEYQNVAGVYDGGLTYSSEDYYGYTSEETDTYRLTLRGDGTFSMVKVSSYSQTEDESYRAEGKFQVTNKKDANGDAYTAIIGSTSGYTYNYEFEFKYTSVGSGKAQTVALEFVSAKKIGSSSYYSTEYEGGELDLTEAAEPYDANAPVYIPYEVEPQMGEYLSTVYYKVTETDDDELDAFLVDGKAAQKEGDYYKVTVPRHSVKIEIKNKTRYAPISITGANLLTVGAYTWDSENLAYVSATKAKHNQKVYIKVEAPVDGSASVRNLTVTYTAKGAAISLKSSGTKLTLNDDGYYEGATMTDMTFGMQIDVAEKSAFLNSSLVGTGGKISGIATSSSGSVTIDQYGDITVKSSDTSSYTTDYYFAPSDVNADGSIDVHSYSTYSAGSIYKLYTNNQGFYAFLDSTTFRIDNLKFFAVGKASLTAAWLIDVDTYKYQTTKAYAKFNDGTNDLAIAFDATGTTPIIDWNPDASINIRNGKSSVLDEGAVFEVKDSTGVVTGTYKNEKQTTTQGVYFGDAFQKGASGTFTGALGELTSDGFDATLANGQTLITYVFGKVGTQDTIAMLTSDGTAIKLTLAALDSTAHTYGPVTGEPFNVQIDGQYVGRMINNSASAHTMTSYYKSVIAGTAADSTVTNAIQETWDTSTSTHYVPTLNADGTFTADDKTFHFSPSGESVFVSTSSSHWLLTRSITNYSSTSVASAVTEVPGGYLYEALPATATDGTRSNDVIYYDDAKNTYEFVTVNVTSGTSWDASGAVFTIVHYDGTVSTEFLNVSGTKAIGNIAGTYAVGTGTDTLVIAGENATYGGVTYSYTYHEDGTISFDVPGHTDAGYNITHYVFTLDKDAKTATVATTVTDLGTQPYSAATDSTTYPWTYDSTAKTWTSPSGFSSTAYGVAFTFYASGTFSFDWAVSSEEKYDYFYVQLTHAGATSDVEGYEKGTTGYYASATVVAHSGTKNGNLSVAVEVGDILTVYYKKDVSGNSGSDNVVLSNLAFADATSSSSSSGSTGSGSTSSLVTWTEMGKSYLG